MCSCQTNFVGSPPGCRPECVMSQECPLNQACVNQKCVDPCPGTCGLSTQCQVIKHSPICSCLNGYTGDPFTRCFTIPRKNSFLVYISNASISSEFSAIKDEPIEVVSNPCVPSPCGAYSECRDIGGQPSCTCSRNYIGSPPNCRPECVVNSECSSNQACIRQKCSDPCLGACGSGSICNVINHTPICSCDNGFTGNPFEFCRPSPPPGIYLSFFINHVQFFIIILF